MAAVLGIAAMVTVVTAAPSVAQGDKNDSISAKGLPRDRGATTLTTNGQSFLEINAANELVHWSRSGESYAKQVRGWGWSGTRAITTLDEQNFLEVKNDGRLSKWSWNGTWYTEAVIGWGWNNARLITGTSLGQFIEVNNQGELAYWTIDGSNGLSKIVRGWGWGATRSITGLDPYLFLEIKGDAFNSVSYWVNGSTGLQEFPSYGSDFRWVRLIAGGDSDHFTTIATDGTLVEFAWISDGDNSRYQGTARGWGWGGTRLIG
ncbi:hypothetical protein AB0E59_45040 [Lentzea sp. NPDC034063]|uniref:hypothetical protein n=1 Tax=unclassified Lentzea TaxID=2643253 RepID=UPI003408D3D9